MTKLKNIASIVGPMGCGRKYLKKCIYRNLIYPPWHSIFRDNWDVDALSRFFFAVMQLWYCFVLFYQNISTFTHCATIHFQHLLDSSIAHHAKHITF